MNKAKGGRKPQEPPVDGVATAQPTDISWKQLILSLPRWLIVLVLVYLALLISYAVFDNRRVDFWPPSIHEKGTSITKSHVLRISRVDLVQGRQADGFRLVVYVNGYAYSYPTTALWGAFGGQGSEAMGFPLAPADQYKISISAWIMTGTSVEKGASSKVERIASHSLDQLAHFEYLSGPANVKYEVE